MCVCWCSSFVVPMFEWTDLTQNMCIAVFCCHRATLPMMQTCGLDKAMRLYVLLSWLSILADAVVCDVDVGVLVLVRCVFRPTLWCLKTSVAR